MQQGRGTGLKTSPRAIGNGRDRASLGNDSPRNTANDRSRSPSAPKILKKQEKRPGSPEKKSKHSREVTKSFDHDLHDAKGYGIDSRCVDFPFSRQRECGDNDDYDDNIIHRQAPPEGLVSHSESSLPSSACRVKVGHSWKESSHPPLYINSRKNKIVQFDKDPKLWKSNFAKIQTKEKDTPRPITQRATSPSRVVQKNVPRFKQTVTRQKSDNVLCESPKNSDKSDNRADYTSEGFEKCEPERQRVKIQSNRLRSRRSLSDHDRSSRESNKRVRHHLKELYEFQQLLTVKLEDIQDQIGGFRGQGGDVTARNKRADRSSVSFRNPSPTNDEMTTELDDDEFDQEFMAYDSDCSVVDFPINHSSAKIAQYRQIINNLRRDNLYRQSRGTHGDISKKGLCRRSSNRTTGPHVLYAVLIIVVLVQLLVILCLYFSYN